MRNKVHFKQSTIVRDYKYNDMITVINK